MDFVALVVFVDIPYRYSLDIPIEMIGTRDNSVNSSVVHMHCIALNMRTAAACCFVSQIYLIFYKIQKEATNGPNSRNQCNPLILENFLLSTNEY